jgi:hypothetical protein
MHTHNPSNNIRTTTYESRSRKRHTSKTHWPPRSFNSPIISAKVPLFRIGDTTFSSLNRTPWPSIWFPATIKYHQRDTEMHRKETGNGRKLKSFFPHEPSIWPNGDVLTSSWPAILRCSFNNEASFPIKAFRSNFDYHSTLQVSQTPLDSPQSVPMDKLHQLSSGINWWLSQREHFGVVIGSIWVRQNDDKLTANESITKKKKIDVYHEHSAWSSLSLFWFR